MSNGLNKAAIRLLSDRRRRFAPLKPALRAILARGFPAEAHKRVLLVHMDDAIAWPQFYPFFHYADRFARAGYVFRTLPYPALGADALVKAADAIFVQAPYEPAEGEIRAVLARLRRANPRAPISFFDWFAPTDVRFAGDVAPFASAYVKKSVLRDPAYYRAPSRGHTFLEEYYCERFGLPFQAPTWPPSPEMVDRLVLGPEFMTGPGLIEPFEALEAAPGGERPIDVHARFAAGARTHMWYPNMRSDAREAVAPLAGRYNVAWEGRIAPSQFMREMRASKICFSPFGYGELCWRDYEAVLAGAVLLKPDMSHLACLSDIFRPGETYVPVRWDLSDLEEKVGGLLADPAERARLTANAFAVAKSMLTDDRLERLLARLTGAEPMG